MKYGYIRLYRGVFAGGKLFDTEAQADEDAQKMANLDGFNERDDEVLVISVDNSGEIYGWKSVLPTVPVR